MAVAIKSQLLVGSFVFMLGLFCVSALDNGLARTPPMGWLSWERYRCNTDCVNYPDSCISDRLYRTMAEQLVSQGYKDVGYEYVNIDDCWMAKERDEQGFLVPDPVRFPNGIQDLANYVHSLGLKLGIYEDFGTKTCGGYPGSKFYMERDANTFAKWGVDMLKLDGCYSGIEDMDEGYPTMELYLNETGRPMLFSCSWPAYVVFNNITPDYKRIAKYCNIWRNYADIQDSWDSVKGIIQFYGSDKGNFSLAAGPGNFNDPDMLIVGDYSLSYTEQQSQMALWAIMAAPLFMSNNLKSMPTASKNLLQNKGVIAVNQDPLGVQGRRIASGGNIEYWMKPLQGKGFAFAVINYNTGGDGVKLRPTIKQLGAPDDGVYAVTEVFSGQLVGLFKSTDNLNISVPVSGVYFGTARFSGPTVQLN